MGQPLYTRDNEPNQTAESSENRRRSSNDEPSSTRSENTPESIFPLSENTPPHTQPPSSINQGPSRVSLVDPVSNYCPFRSTRRNLRQDEYLQRDADRRSRAEAVIAYTENVLAESGLELQDDDPLLFFKPEGGLLPEWYEFLRATQWRYRRLISDEVREAFLDSIVNTQMDYLWANRHLLLEHHGTQTPESRDIADESNNNRNGLAQESDAISNSANDDLNEETPRTPIPLGRWHIASRRRHRSSRRR